MKRKIKLGVFNMNIQTVLFDLDGTLTDSGPGIMNSVQHALKKYGMEVEDISQLRSFVGPPLAKQFELFCGFSEEESKKAVGHFREYYVDKGIYENTVYDGIPEVLQTLKNKGYQLLVATSKPEHLAHIVLDHIGLSQYFDFIGGSYMDLTRTKKSEVIEYVLEQCNCTKREQIVMIGDTSYDMIGAKQSGVHSLGVEYGYGTKEELIDAGAQWLAKTPRDILNVLK